MPQTPDDELTRLHRAEKLEAIGRLAGGVAHDFNNLLTGILGITQHVLDGLKQDDPHRRELEEVITAANKASNLTRQLLAFGRRQMVTPKVMDLNRLILSMKELFRRLLGENVELKLALDPRLGAIRADQGNMEQVVLNLALNARDAMPKGGTLTIETVNTDLNETEARRREVKPGPYVALRVSDTGVGMTPDMMEHIFEPFFTTKAAAQGTGLGLATVYGIVKQNGGDISVESLPGRGTMFRVKLPRLSSSVAVERRGPERRETAAGGAETILVAEDEEIVRRTVVKTLEKKGYKVLEAKNAKEALALSEAHPEKIDLLLTDVVMPGMGGRELAVSLGRKRTSLKILYMSGYTEDIIAQRGLLGPGMFFLEKSFTADSLCHMVRRVLDAPPVKQIPLFPALG